MLQQCYEALTNQAANRWIQIGNFLHKTSVLSGLACGGSILAKAPFERIVIPLACTSAGCASLYAVLWQWDPCSQYQVDHFGDELHTIPAAKLAAQSYTVLIYRNDAARRVLQNVLALSCGLYCAYKMNLRLR